MLLDRDSRPGELATFGPVDPWMARDLAAAQNPGTTWCVTGKRTRPPPDLPVQRLPKCRYHHRLKQHPQWTTPAGRTYTTEPTRYPA